MTKDKNIKKEKKAIKINKKTETKTKRIKINLLNILIILLAFSLLFSLIYKNKESLKNILTKTNKQKAEPTYKRDALKIGDIVYYNHKKAADKNNEAKQTVTIEKGNASDPGSGLTTTQKISVNDVGNDTTWRVWDNTLPGGGVMLISNRPISNLENKGGVGSIWFQHSAHKLCSIFGYGYGADTNATKDFPYKVGSCIDPAPDMNEGDKGNWKIGGESKYKINISGSRALRLKDIEDKLKITEQKILNQENGMTPLFLNESYVKYYVTTMPIMQRDIGSINQKWVNKERAVAYNSNYRITDKNYVWEKSKMPSSKYKDMLFNFKNETENAALVSEKTYNLYNADYLRLTLGKITNGGLYTRTGIDFGISSRGEIDESVIASKFKVITYLKPDLTYYGKPDSDPNKTNEWDIIKPTIENKKVKIGNYQNIDFEPKINLVQNANKTPITKEKNKYVKNIEIKSGQERQGSGDTATFVELKPNTKYTIEIENLPSGYTFEIEGKTNKEIDIKDKTSYTLIFKKDNKEIPTRPAGANELNIGDVVYYNHKITKKVKTNPEDIDEYIPVDDKDLTVTYDKGNAETPGTGYDGTKSFSSKDKKALWKVWDINKTTGEVTLISDSDYILTYIEGGAIGYIWYEYNMHKGASTFGHGYGANINTSFTNTTSRNPNFTYKVGSGLENTGDTARWKIGEEPSGIEKIERSGARALTLGDIEEKLEITDEKIKSGENGIYGFEYGTIAKLNIHFPQRKVKGLNQKWADETIAKAAKQDVEVKKGYYDWKWKNVPEEKQPYKDLIKRNSSYRPATNTLSRHSSIVIFNLAEVDSNGLTSGNGGFMSAGADGTWNEYSQVLYLRLATFLESNLSYFKAPEEDNAWDILRVNSQPKDLEIKTTNLTKTDEKIKINLSSELNGKDIIKNPEIKEINVLANKSDSQNVTVPIYSGQIRTGKLIDAEFIPVHNKYKVEITGLPANSTYKIIGADANGYIDLAKVSSIEAIIYPKAGDYKVPVEYSLGENADDFKVSGNLKLMNGDALVKSQTVELEHKKGTPNKTFVTFTDIDMFNSDKNELNEYEVVFEKTEGRHKVEVNSGKVTVTYVPEEMEINISAKSDGPITLDNIVINLVKKIGENITREEITLENASGFTKKITVPKTDDSGNKITYSIEKKSLNMGYITTISGYDVNLKAVLVLPFTGSSANLKNAILVLGISVFAGIVFRFRKKIVLIFKNYSIMK